jgi:hypothetical protein
VTGEDKRKAVVAVMAMLACGGASPFWTSGPLRTDQVTVNDVYDPHVWAGLRAPVAKVGATAVGGGKRDYFIPYMGPGQTLPAVGASCRISYRHGGLTGFTRFTEWPDSGWIVNSFDCGDGRHWPDGTPFYPRSR